MVVDGVARSSVVRSHDEFDGLCGDVDRRCGNERITYRYHLEAKMDREESRRT